MKPPRRLPLISIPPYAQVYPLGSIPRPETVPLLRFSERGLTLDSDGEDGLAVVGHGEGRRRLVQTLLSKHKFYPPLPPPGPFPLTSSSLQTSGYPPIRHLTFSRPSPSGEFTDYTARYGALQEEDRPTLLDFYLQMSSSPTLGEIQSVAKKLDLGGLLDVPLIGLSSGQTRRSRLGAALLTRARMVLLEDPFAGLDVKSRGEIADLLGKVNNNTTRESGSGSESRSEEEQAGMRMRTVLILRGTGLVGMPKWINKVAEITENNVWVGSREEYVDRAGMRTNKVYGSAGFERSISGMRGKEREEVKVGEGEGPLICMKDVNVAYGSKKVLDAVSWSIYPGDKIHLQGANGSGKTTILALLLGHHPRSYSMPSENLKIFSKPRREIPTPYLRKWIGHTSPEIFAAFPRNMRLTAGEVVGSGYEGVFSRREYTPEQVGRIKTLLKPFEALLVTPSQSQGRQAAGNRTDVDSIFEAEFSHLPASQQAILLFLRSIVARPRLVVLDEFSQTIDEQAWEVCRGVLEREWEEMKREDGVDQAVVVVSHYESEVPWEGGKVFRLKDGKVDTSE